MTKFVRRIGQKLYLYESCYDKVKKIKTQKYIGKIENPSRSLKRIIFGNRWRHIDGCNSISFNDLPSYVVKAINAPQNQNKVEVKLDVEIKPKAEVKPNQEDLLDLDSIKGFFICLNIIDHKLANMYLQPKKAFEIDYFIERSLSEGMFLMLRELLRVHNNDLEP